ncbi:hypothetical protein T484DRAFT_1790426 [Baffinella frigidus]|nr:hypothetical protein T484DRAFT_1790426 [Cryptophyta sp. CCMP2293]
MLAEATSFERAKNYPQDEPYLDGIKYDTIPPGKRFMDMTHLSGAFTNLEAIRSLRMAILLKRALCLAAIGMKFDAEKDVNQAVAEFPEEGEPVFTRALLLVQWGRLPAAVEDLALFTEVSRDHAEGWMLYGSLLHRQGDLAGAAAAISHGLPVDDPLTFWRL